MNIIGTESKHTSGVYGKRDIALVRGAGATVWDEAGQAYIDCVAGIGVANVGHAHPVVAEAISRQAQTLVTCQEMFYNDQRARFTARLAQRLPAELERIYLCNSGTEAVEAALKFARLSTGRTEIIAATRGFHGRTLGALSATHNQKYRKPFAPLLPGFSHIPFNNSARLTEAISDKTAALLLEVVQGEGGVRPADVTFLASARRLCDTHGALLIIDEVQTGYGRTGHFLASEGYQLQPDLICLGKAMAGGVPMGAVGIHDHVSGLAPGLHGSTFGGNPLACAAANAVLDVFEKEALVLRSARLGRQFLEEVRQLDSPLVRDVRGRGLLLGIELRQRAMPIVRALAERGVLALTAGATVVRLMPPLVINEAQLAEVVTALRDTLLAQPVMQTKGAAV